MINYLFQHFHVRDSQYVTPLTQKAFFFCFSLNGVRTESNFFLFVKRHVQVSNIIVAFRVLVQSLIMTGFPCKVWNGQEVAVEMKRLPSAHHRFQALLVTEQARRRDSRVTRRCN